MITLPPDLELTVSAFFIVFARVGAVLMLLPARPGFFRAEPAADDGNVPSLVLAARKAGARISA